MYRCVIVDDNASFLDAARVLLTREGVEVVGIASSSADAISVVREQAPDVVLVDVVLGDESGFDLARELEDSDATVVMISTHAASDVEDLAVASGASAFLPKSQLSAAAIAALIGGG